MANRWLIYRQGAVGDTVLLSPVLRVIRWNDPSGWIEVMGDLDRIGLLLGPQLADSITSSEDIGIESIYTEDDEPLSPRLRKYLEGFTHIVWFSGRPDSRLAKRLLVRPDQRIVTHPAVPHPENERHAVDHNLDALRGWFDVPDPPTPLIQLTQAENEKARQTLEQWGWEPEKDIILGMHVGAGSKEKCVPLNRFLKITRRPRPGERIAVLLTQGPSDIDAEAVKMMVARLGETAIIRVLCERPLREAAAMMQHCRRFLSNDSGMAHIAAALGVTTEVFFVASDPKIWKPLGDRVRIFDLRAELGGAHPNNGGGF